MKELEELRRSIGRDNNSNFSQIPSPFIALEKFIEDQYSPDVIRLLKAKPIPRLKWMRTVVDNKTGE